MRNCLFLFGIVTLILPLAAQAQPLVQSQEGIALENQILQLQQQMQQQQSGGGNSGGSALGGSAPPAGDTSGGTPPDSSVVTNLLNQVGQLQAQVQQLSGQVDTLQNQVNTQHAATEKEIGDLNFKVTGGGAATPGATGAPPAPGATLGTMPATPPPPTAPAASAAAAPTTLPAALKAARTALANHDYANAQSLSQGIINKGASSPQAYSAHYILAESLYAQGKTQSAAIAYDDAYNANRTGVNAPSSLLGLANSLTAIHQEAAACDTLASLNSQFPTPPSGLAGGISAASHRAHCS